MTRKDATGRSHEDEKTPLIVPRSARVIVAIAVGAAVHLVPLPLSVAEDVSMGRDAPIEEAEINDLSAGQSSGAVARCPEGQRLVGGGVGTTGPVSPGLDYTVELSGPLDETGFTANTDTGDAAFSWYASVHNTSGSPRDFKVFAHCSKSLLPKVDPGAPGGDATIQAEPISDLPSGQSGGAAARCQGERRVVGGGVGTTGPVSVGLDYTIELSGPLDGSGLTANTEDNEPAYFWYASIHNTSGSPQDFKVFALCSETSDATLQAEPLMALPSGQSAAAAAGCPSGRRIVGGGVGTTGPVSPGLDYTVELSGPLDGNGSTANTKNNEPAYFWYGSVHNTSGSPQDVKVFALCSGTSDATLQAEFISDVPSATAGGPGGPGIGAGAATCGGKPATVVGTSGPDTISGTPTADVIAGLGGNDILRGLGANDRICGGPGKDRLSGGAGADYLTGGPGADRIFGGPGRDRIIGGPGNDSCTGGPAADKVSGC